MSSQARPASAVTTDAAPPDLATMRETARTVQALDGPPPAADLTVLLDTLRGHVQLLVPDIRALIRAAPVGDYAAAVALVGVDEAWRRLNTPPGFGTDAAYRHACKVALSVLSLCDHWENLARPTVSSHP